jgi:hypothetical protein
VRSKPRFALTGLLEFHSGKRERPDEDGVKKSSHPLLNFYIFPVWRFQPQGWLGDSLRYCRNSAPL